MLITKYLKDFVISGGIDPYADIIESGRKASKKQEQAQHESLSQYEGDTEIEDTTSDDIVVKTTVSSKRLSGWYDSSKAVACMMNTGCFAYVEEKVCLDEPKYIERQESGKMRLTSYAKEHEEECFLQFKVGPDGKLHYVKLPESIADKEFHYSHFISEEILKQLGLVNEMAEMMLEAIQNMKFGAALRELMSKRICDYSAGLLKSTTGLDNKTISQMWNDKSLTKVNVISACLGIHLPFPVSTTMVTLASISLDMFVGPAESKAENRTYHNLLSIRWASDYGDIFDDLKAEGMEKLIKQPPI